MLTFWLGLGGLSAIALGCVIWPLFARQDLQTMPWVKWLLGIVALILPGLAILLYHHWGYTEELANYYQQQKNKQTVANAMQQLGSPEHVIARLKSQLQQHPDAKGWYLLGKLYLSQSDFPQAVEAFANANHLKPHAKEIMLHYAEAQFLAEHGLSAGAKELLEQVLVQQPDNLEAANMLAIAAFQKGDYSQAISRWERLLNQLPPQSEDADKLLQAIAKAQAALKQQTMATISIPVRVQLEKGLEHRFDPKTTVFIYAQAAEGPKLPLAIIRKQIGDLPLTISLDNTMSMLEEMNLEKFTRIRLVARVSLTGQAIPQTGDFIGKTAVFNSKTPPKDLTIIIDKPIE